MNRNWSLYALSVCTVLAMVCAGKPAAQAQTPFDYTHEFDLGIQGRRKQDRPLVAKRPDRGHSLDRLGQNQSQKTRGYRDELSTGLSYFYTNLVVTRLRRDREKTP